MPGPDFVPVNKSSYWLMIGFAFFMFEGIGCLMPVMSETKKPKELPVITILALSVLTLVFTSFSFLCYYTWGGNLTEPVVTQMLP